LRSKSACSAKQSKRLNKTEGFVKPRLVRLRRTLAA
jgi:hypothetical protein